MAEDPFEKAVEEEFQRARERTRTQPSDDVPPASDKVRSPGFGRDGARSDQGPTPRGGGRSGSVPSVGRSPLPTGPDARREPDAAPYDPVEAARQSPDYVGDYPHDVPRWDDAATPTEGALPERRLEADRMSAPGSDSVDGRLPVSNAGWLSPGPSNARLCYLLNLGGVFLPFLPLIGGAMAWMNRGRVGADLATHYTYALRTVGLGFVLSFGINLVAGGRLETYGTLVLVALGWWFARNLRGLMRLGSGRSIPNPKTLFL